MKRTLSKVQALFSAARNLSMSRDSLRSLTRGGMYSDCILSALASVQYWRFARREWLNRCAQ